MSKQMNTTKYKYRLIARIMIEVTTPLAVGSGDKDIITDAPIARDVNGLPYIPGTSLTGVIRHSLGAKDYVDKLFGFQKGEDGCGSKIIVSDALLVDEHGKATDGLRDTANSEFLNVFRALPIRQHLRMNDKGTAMKHCKFDEEIVYAGTRFCFEMEIMADEDDNTQMSDIIKTLAAPSFRIGSGTRNGFGAMKIVRIQHATYDLSNSDDMQAYISKSSCLTSDWDAADVKEIQPEKQSGWIRYILSLQPTDFFLFSSGFGDNDADITPVKEKCIEWSDGHPEMTEEHMLIPGSSVKGAVAHRTAYHWNRINENFADYSDFKKDANPAVEAVFGTMTGNDETHSQRGNAIFSDVMVKGLGEKIVFHIKTDKFTGSVQDGALFQEKVSIADGQQIVEEIIVDEKAFNAPTAREAFERALKDICNGLLPLGGGTNRGNGTFTGTLKIEE